MSTPSIKQLRADLDRQTKRIDEIIDILEERLISKHEDNRVADQALVEFGRQQAYGSEQQHKLNMLQSDRAACLDAMTISRATYPRVKQ